MAASRTTLRFWEIASELSLVTAEQAAQVAEQVLSDDEHPGSTALRLGWLDSTQVQIVETLLRAKETIPGYEILGLLGHGGMGVVYRARHLSLQRVVALKTLQLGGRHAKTALDRFQREARAVARLQHPQIVTAYDFGEAGSRVYFAMELVEGLDADAWVAQQGPRSEYETWCLLIQAAAGLAYANEHGIVHRDVKPANLLLVEPPLGFPIPAGVPLVKIADFGLAALSEEGNSQTRVLSEAGGSPHYMAPEQLSGTPVDWRADVFALGTTAIHLMSGRPPFDGCSLNQIIAQKLSGKTPLSHHLPDQISTESRQLVDWMTAMDPEDRPRSYAELMGHLQSAIARHQPPNSSGSSGSGMLRQVTLSGHSLHRGIATTQQLTPVTAMVPDSHSAAGGQATRPRAGGGPPTDPIATTGTILLSDVRSGRRTWLRRIGQVGLAAGLLGVVGWTFWPRPAKPAVRRHRRDGRVEYLFDGQTLKGWKLERGGWNIETDVESGARLRGEKGSILRTLVVPQDAQERSEPYALQLAVTLGNARTVDVDLERTAGTAPRTLTLRLKTSGIALGESGPGPESWQPIVESRKLEFPPDEPIDVQLENQRDHWWLIINEQHVLIGPIDQAVEWQPLFRLRVDGGPAYFSDISFSPLVPIEASSAIAPPQ